MSDRATHLRATVLGCIACVVLVAAPAAPLEPEGQRDVTTSFTSTPRESTVVRHRDWMKRLPDRRQLSRLTLPGTHNSCALRDGYAFGFAKCQSWSVADQLRVGVRFLDVRCRHISNQFQIYHGAIDQQQSFASVRDACQAFLRRSPSECIVMSIKEESAPRQTTQSFADTFQKAILRDGTLWHIQPRVPDLGSVRGKIVLVDRVGTLGGIPWRALERQDDYMAPLEKKTKLIQAHIQRASRQTAQASKHARWFINFCSGTLPASLITPRRYAQTTNLAAWQALQRQRDGASDEGARVEGLGVIVMDFPGEALIERIVSSNDGASEPSHPNRSDRTPHQGHSPAMP